MGVETGATAGPLSLRSAERAILAERLRAAIAGARTQRRRVLAALTVSVDPALDLAALVFRSRRADDRFFCLEQPDRDGFALAALGQAAVVEAAGEGRLAAVTATCRAMVRDSQVPDPADDPAAPPASGPVWLGGLAFAPDGGSAPEWAGVAPAQLVLPELALARRGQEARLTLSAMVEGDEDVEAVVARLEARLAELRPGEMPLADPDPVESPTVAGAAPPEHFEAAVERAVERIARGELEKIVLARVVRVHAPGPIDPAPVFDGLRTGFPACYCFCVGTPELAFVGASPELLVRREGARAQTVALAGTTRRSADPAVDRHLGEQLLQSAKDRAEQAIVARRIERALRPVSVWVATADEPVLVKVQNVQHLATAIRAQLRDPLACLELAERLHPTPAVGGEPSERALPLIPALEGLDRGWYAGAIGWTDLQEDGELCVALRCALLRDRVAHLFAGCGIVRDSQPAAELAESEVKLEALLPLLS